MEVYLVDQSTLISEQGAFQIAWALDRQARFQFGRQGWRSDVRCYYVNKGVKPTVLSGQMVLHLVDDITVANALGFHDEDGNEVPYAQIGVRQCQQDNDPVSEVASHELLELAVDPHVNLSALTGDGRRLYAYEVGDPCQGNAYDVLEPEGKQSGIMVADFALPNYFDPNTAAGAKTSFRGATTGPFSLAPQGYMSFVDLTNLQAGWQEEFGEKRDKAPAWSNRHDRRLNTSLPHSA